MSLPRKPIYLLICAFLAAFHANLAHAQTSPSGPIQEVDPPRVTPVDPIATAAYGQLLDYNGRAIEVTPEFLRETLDLYIGFLLERADADVLEEYEGHAAALKEALGADEMSAKFLLLEWLAERTEAQGKAYLYAKNRTMRMAWYKLLYGEKRYYEIFDRASGFPPEIFKIGEGREMLRKATEATGRAYMEECRKAGVPVPPTWGTDEWQYVGDLATNFVNSGNPASVYRFDSKEPEGMCIALPRISGQTISLLGIICHGKVSSNACFYDRAGTPVGDEVPIEDFLSGGNLGDVCSDCHAGENPYVVHGQGTVLDLAPDNRTDNWYFPLVRPDWPLNPGPSLLLSQVPINEYAPDNDASCLDCHADFQSPVAMPAKGGRFPDILALNQIATTLDPTFAQSGYCGTVLLNAMGSTMPGGGAYEKHVKAMTAFCGQQAPPGGTVPNPGNDDDREVLSPPVVIGPLYSCAEGIEVRGALYGAELTVSIDGTPLPTIKVTKPSQTILSSPPLVAGQIVTAVQELNGVVSDPSVPVEVQDTEVVFKDGMPAPEIDPTLIHQCGRTIAVRHVRGANVTILTNGGDDVTYSSGGDWTNMPPAIRPFQLGHRYVAVQSLCTIKSDPSNEEQAVAPPNVMPVPKLDPLPPIAGQQLLNATNLAHGALTELFEGSAGGVASFSTAIDFFPEIDVASALGRPIVPGDQFSITSELCDASKTEFPPARPCERLEAPQIARPLVGATSVIVTRSVPGAQIHVYDAGMTEIGDGSGTTVGLTRAIVPGDVLTVTQRLGECVSGEAFQIAAACGLDGDCG